MNATQTTHDAATCPSRERPIDLVHLARQTGGSQSLEREVLGIMERQIADAMEKSARGQGNFELKPTAHAMRGAASNLGAFPLARAARRLESAPADRDALAGFRHELERTLVFIRALAPGAGRVDAAPRAH